MIPFTRVSMRVANSRCRVEMAVDTSSIQYQMSTVTKIVTQIHPSYSGGYEFTPDDTTQIVATAGQVLEQDIVINPVPNTYGHVAWDGRFISVF